jgi:hypothetical protein
MRRAGLQVILAPGAHVTQGVNMRRRKFLGVSPFYLLGAQYACARQIQSQAVPGTPELREELSASEIESVSNSVMAKDLDNFFGKGFS